MATPASASMRPVASVSQGSDDEVSSSSEPGLRPRSRPSSPATSACTTAPFGTIVTTMSLRAASSAGVRATCAPASAAASFVGAAGRDVVQRHRVAGGGEMRGHRPAHHAETDEAERRRARCHGVQGFTRKAARKRAASRSMQANTARPASGNDTLFAGLDRPPQLETTPMKAFRILAPFAAAFALVAGAPGASAQTVLTMSSWVPPTHSLTRDVLARLGQAGRDGDQRPGQVRDAAQASVGARPEPSTRSATAWSTSRS